MTIKYLHSLIVTFLLVFYLHNPLNQLDIGQSRHSMLRKRYITLYYFQLLLMFVYQLNN